MSAYKAPVRDMEFIFHDVLQLQNSEIPGYQDLDCLLYTSPSPRDRLLSRMPSSA